MRLASSLLLRKSLQILSAIASDPSQASAEKDRIENRIHIEWGPWDRPIVLPGSAPIGAVTLTATDGHRACFISIAADPAFGYNPGQALIVAPETEQWPRLSQLDTIFLNAQGHVCAMGRDPGAPTVLAPGATPAIQPWGVDLGTHPEGVSAFPIDKLREIRKEIKQQVGAVRMMEINSQLMADGLTIINALWDRDAHEDVPRRIDMHLPGHRHAPMMFDSQYPNGSPHFAVTYIIMPFRSP